MRIRRILVGVGTAIALLALLLWAGSFYWVHTQMPFQNAPKLIVALQTFCRDQAARGRRLPPEIPVQNLVQAGYLTSNDVAAFAGMDLTFSTSADDSRPQTVLGWARTPGDQFICLLSDGSVQQCSPQRYQAMRALDSQSDAMTNGSQLPSPAANQTSGAAAPAP